MEETALEVTPLSDVLDTYLKQTAQRVFAQKIDGKLCFAKKRAPLPKRPTPEVRGMRIEQAADYSGLAPSYIEQCCRDGSLQSVGGPGSAVCQGYVIYKEKLDEFMDRIFEQEQDRKAV
jgi:hypothetical protein